MDKNIDNVDNNVYVECTDNRCVETETASKVTDEKRNVTSIYFTKQMEKNHDNSLDDFQPMKTTKKNAAGSKPIINKQKSKSRSIKDRTQSDIRKALTRKQLSSYRREINDICTEQSCDVDPEQMQLAIALSESLSNFEVASSSKQSVESSTKRITLDQFGFVPKATAHRNFRIPVPSRVRRKRLRPYDLLIKTTDDKKQFIIDRYSKLLFENNNITENCYQPIGKLTELLEKHRCSKNTVFCKSFMSYFEMENSDVFYIGDIIKKSSVKPGYFLKDWSKIPGRDASPSKVVCDTVDLTVDDQDELDVLLSGTLEVCQTKFKNSLRTRCPVKNITQCNTVLPKIDENVEGNFSVNTDCKILEAQTSDSVKLDTKDDTKLLSSPVNFRNLNKSPDLFEEESSPECSFIISSRTEEKVGYDKIENDIYSSEDEDLPKIVLTQINNAKNCNNADSKCCSQKSCLMDLTECVGAIETTYSETGRHKNSFLNDLIDLTQPEVCHDANVSESANVCEVSQVYESENGICHYEVFCAPKECVSDENLSHTLSNDAGNSILCRSIPLDETVNNEYRECEDEKNALINISKVADLENDDLHKYNETPRDWGETSIKYTSKTANNTINSYKDFREDFDSITSIAQNSANSKSTVHLDFSVSLSSGNEIIDISDEELNYSVSKANKIRDLNSSVADKTALNFVRSAIAEESVNQHININTSGEPNDKCEKGSGNFELGGSSIFSDILSFSERNSNASRDDVRISMTKPQNKRLIQLKCTDNAPKTSSNENFIDDSLPFVKISSKDPLDKDQIEKKFEFDRDVTINVTPTSKSYIVKTDNVTPLPDYQSMESPELNIYLDKYGIRKLKRKRAIQLLEHIYYQTHPLVDCSGDNENKFPEEEHKHPKKRKKLFSGSQIGEGTSTQQSNEEKTIKEQVSRVSDVRNVDRSPEKNVETKVDKDIDLYLCSRNGVMMKAIICNPDDWIFQKREKAKIPGCRVPLHIAFHNYLSSRPELHEMILRYEPVSIDLIHKGLVLEGHRYDPKDLFKFLDKKCITVKTEDKSGASRHTKKSTGNSKKK